MEYKLKKKHLKIYRRAVRLWLTNLNLLNWKVWVIFEEVEGAYGFCRACPEGMCAVIGLNPVWQVDKPTKAKLEEVAKHEALELLMAPLWHAVLARELNHSWAESQRHSIVRTLEEIMV